MCRSRWGWGTEEDVGWSGIVVNDAEGGVRQDGAEKHVNKRFGDGRYVHQRKWSTMNVFQENGGLIGREESL